MSVVAGDERLFEVGPAVEASPGRGPVDKTFRHYDVNGHLDVLGGGHGVSSLVAK